MEACLHFRGAALNASEAGISRPRSADGPLRTAVAKAIILPLWGPRGIDQLESYDFGAERKRLKSPDRCLFNRAERVMDGCLLDKLVLARGQVPLDFDEGRDQRKEVCDEGVGLRGESQVSNDFPKIVDKIPDDRGRNRGKPGPVTAPGGPP